VAKNRFDGELGIMLLKFDKDTLSFAVKSSKESGTHTKKTNQTANSPNDGNFV